METLKSPFELFVARRYLRAKRKQAVISLITMISVVGVAAGVMALVIALAINNGFRDTLQTSLLGAYAHVNVMEKEPGSGIENWSELVERLRKLPHVVAASPALYGQVFISFGGGGEGALLKGIRTDEALRPTDMLRHMKAGSLEDLKDDERIPGIILGSKLAQALGVKMGNIVRVISPQGETTPLGVFSSEFRFRVVGLFESGFYEVDSLWAFTSLQAAQRMLSLDDVVNSIELKLDDIYTAPAVASEADKLVGPNLAAATWMEMNKHILSALNMEKVVTWITIGLIVLVAALNILITLVMMVMEKNRDIAILVSMGAKQQQIRRIFQYQGLLIGVIGTAAGLAVGHLLCFLADKYRWIRLDEEVYALSYVPFSPRWLDSLWIAALAILVSYIATLYPARAASRVAPAEALRYE
ncbi:MAG: FtsX-like permease family protein [Rhodospirillales bacterium]